MALRRPAVGADWAERADRARTLRVLRTEAEVASGDALGRRLDSSFDTGVIRRHLDDVAAAQVEKEQACIWPTRHEPAAGSQTVEPQLHRVSLHERGVERWVGLVVDKDGLAVQLADPAAQAPHAFLTDPHVDPGLDRQRLRTGKRMR